MEPEVTAPYDTHETELPTQLSISMWNVTADAWVVPINVSKSHDPYEGRSGIIESRLARNCPDILPHIVRMQNAWYPRILWVPEMHLILAPTLDTQYGPAAVSRIYEILDQLRAFADSQPDSMRLIALPYLGCGAGRLDRRLVRTLCNEVLDYRFVICALPMVRTKTEATPNA